MKSKGWAWGAGAVGAVFAGALIWWLMGGSVTAFRDGSGGGEPQSLDPRRVEQGRVLYVSTCAQCHGAAAEGQPDWRRRNPDGTYPAPPHDSTGHTWHHADGLLLRIVRDGGAIYEDSSFSSKMPAFGDTLSEEEIMAVITYLKSLWDTEKRSFQAQASLQDPFPAEAAGGAGR